MKNNVLVIALGLLIVFGPASFAATGRPAWSLFSETAYNLKQGQVNASMIGWVNYGLTNKLQVGTNGLLDIFQVPNFYGKYVLVEESDLAPQVSIGSSLYYPLAASTPISVDFAVNLSRAFDNGNYIVHGGIKQTTNINDSALATSNPINTPGLGFKAGVITNQSDLSHFFVEAYANWVPIGRSSELAVGADFISENRTVSVSGLFYAADSMDRRASFLPFVNVQWSF
ncbi:MAG: hypothetical protein WC632_08120 [Candidatus Margulisiibacteriota bacterium]